MVYYGQMGIMDQHLGKAIPTTILQQPVNLWKNRRGTVLRIEALTLMAIVLAFFVVAFGSCHRWTNRWIVQKGFLIANASSLSLGIYSIGLMQSSPVKSKMYLIWAVSLLTLFSCVDSVTVFSGLDYKSSLSKMLFQLCLYFGYVLLLSMSTISTHVGNIAISVLAAITFIKGFHRSLSLVMPKRMRSMLDQIEVAEGSAELVMADPEHSLNKYFTVDFANGTDVPRITMADITSLEKDDLPSFRDECFAFSLSHMLQRHFLGLTKIDSTSVFTDGIHEGIIYKFKRTLKMVEVELAFLYETFFTSNAFLHYYESKTSSLWAFASIIGICFVGTVIAVPGAFTRHQTTSPGPATDTIIVDTTTADVIVTLIILVSLALLQLLQLIRCWMSNWARVAFACECARRKSKMLKQLDVDSEMILLDEEEARTQMKGISRAWWMRLKVLIVSRTNWFDKYLWQNKLGQYSLLVAQESCWIECELFCSSIRSGRPHPNRKCAGLVRMLGMQYIAEVLWDLWGSDSNKGSAIRLEDNVKASITDFLDEISGSATNVCWTSFLVDNGVELKSLPYIKSMGINALSFAQRVTRWHIATCYCELMEQKKEKQEERTCCMETSAATAVCFKAKTAAAAGEKENNRLVANALSKYCIYLMGSAPELLPGRAKETKERYNDAASGARNIMRWGFGAGRNYPASGDKDKLERMQKGPLAGDMCDSGRQGFWQGVDLGKSLLDKTRCSDPWKVLARLWVQTLVYAAPYGEVQAHMQHLAQRGEFITHIWALLYHSGIYGWKSTCKRRGGGQPVPRPRAPRRRLRDPAAARF